MVCDFGRKFEIKRVIIIKANHLKKKTSWGHNIIFLKETFVDFVTVSKIMAKM